MLTGGFGSRYVRLAQSQSLELLGRQRHIARRSWPVRRVAVKVGSAGDKQSVLTRQRGIAGSRGRIVIGMVRLERVNAGGDKLGDPFVVTDETRVSERSEAAGVVNAGNHSFRPGARARDERRPAAHQQSVERFN
jgi:hypothetical protein